MNLPGILHVSTERPCIKGNIIPPPDKSITIRALVLASLAEDISRVENPLISETTNALLESLRRIGVEIEVRQERDQTAFHIKGGLPSILHPKRPFNQLKDPLKLNLGGSATAFRLLLGMLAGINRRFVLTGDETLKHRPMDRVVEPLREMGARITYLGAQGYPPILLEGTSLSGITYELPVPSAQVKSAILLAGLNASGRTTVIESIATRDHTERMLPLLGVKVEISEGQGKRVISVETLETRKGFQVRVPGDFSSAFLPITLSLLLKDSELTCEGVGLNPTRLGAISVLKSAGAKISIDVQEKLGNEEVGKVFSRTSDILAFSIDETETPSMIDELPLLALIATQAKGTSRICGLRELKVKESDRAQGTVSILKAFGAGLEIKDDGLVIEGPQRLSPAKISVPKDHRMAMLALACAIVAGGDSEVLGFSSVKASWPEVLQSLQGCGLKGVVFSKIK